MTTDHPDAERARASLRCVVEDLHGRIERGELTAADMILGCRRILDEWVESGGSSLDGPVVGFLAVECQTDHVLGGRSARTGRDADRMRFAPGSPQEAEEVEACGRWFLGAFKRDIRSLHASLGESSRPAVQDQPGT
ncbi:MAG TPA: hypothetical protein VGB79_05785 [Allosphingosinicella sp.]|jgi:hypothetical protein